MAKKRRRRESEFRQLYRELYNAKHDKELAKEESEVDYLEEKSSLRLRRAKAKRRDARAATIEAATDEMVSELNPPAPPETE